MCVLGKLQTYKLQTTKFYEKGYSLHGYLRNFDTFSENRENGSRATMALTLSQLRHGAFPTNPLLIPMRGAES